MILFLDTTDFNKMVFALGDGDRVKRKVYRVDPHHSHETLEKLAEFLRANKIKHGDINKVVVNKGPGSYTGTRVGVTHALALSFAWQVPAQALAKEQFEKKLAMAKAK